MSAAARDIVEAMAPAHRPLPTRFFPLARTAVSIGVVVAAFGGALLRSAASAPQEIVAAPFLATESSALKGPVIAHVWLESCPDCMGAFAAHAHQQDEHALAGMTQMNVAYGTSTPAFRARYRVEENLLEDPDGSQVVNRFGIGSFTTLVIDRRGEVLLRDRPDSSGYLERVREAWARAR